MVKSTESTPRSGNISRRTLFGGVLGAATLFALEGCAPQSSSPTEAPATTTKPDTKTGADKTALLDPAAVRNMSPQQRLEAIRIPEDLMNKPEDLVKKYHDVQAAIYSCGSTLEEFTGWRSANTGSETYAEYVVKTYYLPLFGQLHGKDLSTLPRDNEQIANMYAMATRMWASIRAHKDTNTPIFRMQYAVSDIKTSGNEISYTAVGFDGIEESSISALQSWNESIKVMPKTPERHTFTPRYDAAHETVVVDTVFTK